jgi:hypothetical protein
MAMHGYDSNTAHSLPPIELINFLSLPLHLYEKMESDNQTIDQIEQEIIKRNLTY